VLYYTKPPGHHHHRRTHRYRKEIRRLDLRCLRRCQRENRELGQVCLEKKNNNVYGQLVTTGGLDQLPLPGEADLGIKSVEGCSIGRHRGGPWPRRGSASSAQPPSQTGPSTVTCTKLMSYPRLASAPKCSGLCLFFSQSGTEGRIPSRRCVAPLEA